MLGYLGLTTMQLVDLLFMGRVSPEALGAVGVGSAFFGWAIVTGIGLLSGLDTLISQAYGAGDLRSTRESLVQGLWIAVGTSIPFTLALVWVASHLENLGIHPNVAVHAKPYLTVLAFSLLPALVFSAIRQFFQAMSLVRPAMMVLIGANLLNAFLNWVFVFGHLGFSPMGAEGSAWGTLLGRVAMMLAMTGILHSWDSREGRLNGTGRVLRGSAWHFDPERTGALLRLGIPASLQLAFEVGVFTVATALAGRLRPVDLAAHQIVLNIASTTFMVTMGISSATAVLVGQSLGRRDPFIAVKWGWRGMGLALAFMTGTCIVMLLIPGPLLRVYTSDVETIRVGTSILFVAALFQISDGLQVVGSGALRGAGDTRSSMIVNWVGHWCIGLPAGIFLCFRQGLGLQGLWIGLSVGLTAVAVGLVIRWRQASHRLVAQEQQLHP